MAQSYRVECSRQQLQCLVIADDLTGACDAAAPFRRQGASVRVVLDMELDSLNGTVLHADVLAFSTDSRDLAVPEIGDRLRRVAGQVLKHHPDSRSTVLVFKKIDSTLRGNPGEEIAAALDAFDCEVAVITPAFPDMGRHVREGYLHSDRDPAWLPLDVGTLLRTQGLNDCNHVSPFALQAALARGARFISLDTSGNEDLDAVVTQTLRCPRRVLWAGSAGLAAALARAMYPASVNHCAVAARQSAPVLFAIGSHHVVTTAQVAELCRHYPAHHVEADSATPEHLAAALRSRRHTVLTIGRNTTSAEHLGTLLRHTEQLVGALLLSGGDTAALVCGALAARAITLEGEIVTGLPWGILNGGGFETLPVATKSGAFGGPNALIEVADFFSCQAP